VGKKVRRIGLRKDTAAVAPARSETAGGEFNPDYSYVRADLRRIGILAGGFLAVLVVLAFFVK